MRVSRLYSYAAATLCLMGLMVSSCDTLSPDRPEEATVRLEGIEGATVQIITSANFLSQRNALYDPETRVLLGDTVNVLLLVADTTFVTLPFEQTYDIRQFEKFYAEIQRVDPDGDGLYSRVWIDSDLRMDKRPFVEEETVVFTYDFRVANGEDPDIVF